MLPRAVFLATSPAQEPLPESEELQLFARHQYPPSSPRQLGLGLEWMCLGTCWGRVGKVVISRDRYLFRRITPFWLTCSPSVRALYLGAARALGADVLGEAAFAEALARSTLLGNTLHLRRATRSGHVRIEAATATDQPVITVVVPAAAIETALFATAHRESR
jgi:hypothetical protein